MNPRLFPKIDSLHRFLLAGVLLASSMVFMNGCRDESSGPNSEASAQTQPAAWPGIPYTKVVAHQFRDTPSGGVLCPKEHRVDFDGVFSRLEQYGVAKRELSRDEVAAILNSTVGYKRPEGQGSGAARCYIPHHILIFYADDGRPVAALEICVLCGRFRISPDPEECGDHIDLDNESLKRQFEKLGLRETGVR